MLIGNNYFVSCNNGGIVELKKKMYWLWVQTKVLRRKAYDSLDFSTNKKGEK